jgi:hypothetical protein
MRLWDSGLLTVTLLLNCLGLVMTWRARGSVRYLYTTVYFASFLALDPLRCVVFFKFGHASTEYFLTYWFADYLARLLLCLAALEFIELALGGSRPQIAKPAFFLLRLFAVAASGIVFIVYCVPRLTSRGGHFEFELAIYLPSTLLVLLAWMAFAQRGRYELQPRILVAALGLNSVINLAAITMQQLAITVESHQLKLIVSIATRAGPVVFLIMEALWVYAVTCLGPPQEAEAREGEWIRASDSPSTLTVAFTRAKEEA